MNSAGQSGLNDVDGDGGARWGVDGDCARIRCRREGFKEAAGDGGGVL